MGTRQWTAAMGVCCAVAFGAVRLTAGEVRSPVMDQGPVIDGKIEADEWALSTGFDGFGGNDGELVQARVSGYVGRTLTHIYVAIKSRLPDEGTLLAAVQRDSAKTVYDDAVEVFVNPSPDSPRRWNTNYWPTPWANAATMHARGGAAENPAWRGNWKQSHGFHDGWWHFECEIPITSMGQVAEKRRTTDGAWRINLTRDWKHPWQWSSLSATEGATRLVECESSLTAKHRRCSTGSNQIHSWQISAAY